MPSKKSTPRVTNAKSARPTRPAVACDVVAFALKGTELRVLLIERKNAPFKGHWALPGGFVNADESLERAAARELEEETGLTGARMEQLRAYGDPGRDPRGHTISIVYVAFLPAEALVKAGDDAANAEWHSFRALPEALAFDHARILRHAYRRLLRHLDDPTRDPAAFAIVPTRFTLAELKHAYEAIVGRALTKTEFRKAVIDRGLVTPAGARTVKKTAQLYRWNRPRTSAKVK